MLRMRDFSLREDVYNWIVEKSPHAESGHSPPLSRFSRVRIFQKPLEDFSIAHCGLSFSVPPFPS